MIYAIDMHVEEEEDGLGIEKARIFITNQNKLIEDTKVAKTIRPDLEVNLEQVRKEVSEKV